MKKLLVLAFLVLATVGLPGGSGCDGNLGDVSTGPVSFRASVATNFTPADGPSTRPTTNFDGNLVAFESRALNLTRTEPGFKEILIRDRNAQTVTSASRLVFETNKSGLADCESPAMSADGNWVIFTSRRDLPSALDPPAAEAFSTIWRYLNDPQNPQLSIIVPTLPFASPETPIDGDCLTPAVSGDGDVIAFTSLATNIDTTPAYTMGANAQVFAVDIDGGVTRLISHAFGAPGTPCNNAAENPVVSTDGQWIVFESRATNLIAGGTSPTRKIYRASLDGSVVELVSRMDGLAGTEANNHCTSTSINGDGTLIAFAFQGGNLAPAPNSGDLGFPLIVRDYSDPLNPVNRVVADDCFLFGIFNPILVGDRAAMSVDGRSIAYTGVTAGLTDLVIKVADTNGGGTKSLSKGIIEPGVTTLEDLFVVPTISGDGRWVFWRSDYTQEVIGDTNALGDVFGYGPLR